MIRDLSEAERKWLSEYHSQFQQQVERDTRWATAEGVTIPDFSLAIIGILPALSRAASDTNAVLRQIAAVPAVRLMLGRLDGSRAQLERAKGNTVWRWEVYPGTLGVLDPLGSGFSRCLRLLLSVVRSEGLCMAVRLDALETFCEFCAPSRLEDIRKAVKGSRSLPLFMDAIADSLKGEPLKVDSAFRDEYRTDVVSEMLAFADHADPAVACIGMLALRKGGYATEERLKSLCDSREARERHAASEALAEMQASRQSAALKRGRLPYPCHSLRIPSSRLPRTEQGARKAVTDLCGAWEMFQKGSSEVNFDRYIGALARVHLYSHKRLTCDFLETVDFEIIV